MNDANNENDDDDFLGGFSIMKDLLADLAVDDDDDNNVNGASNWLSLEQLEQELKQLENENTMLNNNTNTNDTTTTAVTSAAAAVLQQQMLYNNSNSNSDYYNNYQNVFQSPLSLQIPQQSMYDTNSSSNNSITTNAATTITNNNNNTAAMDAWTLSLQKFTASSLEADFLQADLASRNNNTNNNNNNQSTTTATTSNLQFESYNVREPIRVIAPPPGMMNTTTTSSSSSIPLSNTTTTTISQQQQHEQEQEQQQQLLISQAAAKLVQQLTSSTTITTSTIPVTTTNNGIINTNDKEIELAHQLTRNLQAIHEHEALNDNDDDEEGTIPHVTMKVPPRPQPVTPQNSISSIPLTTTTTTPRNNTILTAPTPQTTPIVANVVPPITTTTTTVPTVPSSIPSGMPLSSQQPQQIPPQQQLPIPTPVGVVPVVAVPLPPPMAWQSPSPQMVQMMGGVPIPPPPPPLPPVPQKMLFANPNPAALPIPATALKSRYMSSRDIAFVVHGMLKPILASENLGSMSTYHLEYWTRHHPVKPPMPTSVTSKQQQQQQQQKGKTNDTTEETKMDIVSLEIQARHVKTKEWSSEKKVLGSIGKTDVTRPRALVAISSSKLGTTENDDGNDTSSLSSIKAIKQQRAALWKSRIYCDQAYQCYNAVVDSWSISATGNNVGSSMIAPSSVQPHLLKLTKCLGISIQTVLVDTTVKTESTESIVDETKQFRNQYSIDVKVLELLLKLPKGKILLARVLEQALLPPSIVHVLLPAALSILFAAPISNDDDIAYADDRIFHAWTEVIDTIPDISSKVIQETVTFIMKLPSSISIAPTERMQCTHALLQRGALIATTDPQFAPIWQDTENEFLNYLSSM